MFINKIIFHYVIDDSTKKKKSIHEKYETYNYEEVRKISTAILNHMKISLKEE